MAEKQANLFNRLTKLFRSGPTVRKKVANSPSQMSSSAKELFQRNVSDIYASTVAAYGSFDRMCISLDTKIPIPGPEKYLTMKELIERYSDGEKFLVYAYDFEKKSIVPAWAHHPRSSGVRETVKITFDDGTYLICTPDHPCMTRDGTFKNAGDLSPGDSMMPFYRKDFQGSGYYNIYTTCKDGRAWNGWRPEHHIIAEWSSNKVIEKGVEHVHHIDFNPSNNNPENLAILDAKDHLSYHARLAEHHKSPEYRAHMSKVKKKAWEKNDEEGGQWRENLVQFNKRDDVREMRRLHMIQNNPSKRKEVAEKISQKQTARYQNPDERSNASNRVKSLYAEGKLKTSESFKNYWKGRQRPDEWKESRTGKNHHSWIEIDIDILVELILNLKERKLVANALQTSPATIGRRAKHLLGGNNWDENVIRAELYRKENHKVFSVEPWIAIETGDLTVDGYENFATDSIIVHNSRYSDFAEMEATPEIGSALDIYAEESSSQDENGKILHIHSDNRIIRDLLENLFYDVLNVDFNLPMWTRNLCKYGDLFLFNDVSPEYGVVNVFPIPVAEIEREEGFDPQNPMAVRYRWITKGNTILENWQVTHFRLLGNDAFLPYGSSVLESARRIWRQLILIEDAMLVYRIVRAPERRIFYIDVGNIPPEDIENYLQQQQTSLKRNKAIDRVTGKVDLRYNPLSVDDDYYIPVRGGESGTKIDTLAGGQNTAAIEDVQYIQKKLFAALKIPKAYLGYDEDIGAKATLAQEDIRFSRTIAKIQKVIISELNKLAIIHLYSHGFSDDDVLNFKISLNNPSSVAQLQKLELIKTKFDIAGSAPEGSVDRSWIRKNILGLTNEEIDLIKEGRKKDKLEDEEVEATTLEKDESPGADDEGGDDFGFGGEEEAEGEEIGGEEAGGEEDLFASDEKEGNVLGEVDEEVLDLSGLPLKPSTEGRKGVFANKKDRKRKRFSNSKAEIPDFLTMVNDKRSQSTSNNPYGLNLKNVFENDLAETSLMKDSSLDDRYLQTRKTSETSEILRNLAKIKQNSVSIIFENNENFEEMLGDDSEA